MQKVKSGTTEQRPTSYKFIPLRFDTLDTGCHVCVSHFRDKDGYIKIEWNEDGKREKKRLHRMVYELHNGPITHGKVICHTCDNPSCCNPNHLFAGTVEDNIRDKIKKGRHAKGEMCGGAKLTAEQVDEIIERLPFESNVSLADEFGVKRWAINRIRNGKSWKHMYEPKQSNRTSHLPVTDDGDSINHQPHHTGREPYCVPVQLTNDYSL